jgi:hypothetical protein
VCDKDYGTGVRERLLKRGWVENHNQMSPLYNFRWTLRGQDLQFEGLGDGVLVNHFKVIHTVRAAFTRLVNRALPINQGLVVVYHRIVAVSLMQIPDHSRAVP